jgi:hypothetical protein
MSGKLPLGGHTAEQGLSLVQTLQPPNSKGPQTSWLWGMRQARYPFLATVFHTRRTEPVWPMLTQSWNWRKGKRDGSGEEPGTSDGNAS